MAKKKNKDLVGRIKEGSLSALERVKKLTVTGIVTSSFKKTKKSWRHVLLASLADFVFLILFSMTVTVFQMRAFDHLYELLQIVGTATGGLVNDIQNPLASSFTSLSTDPVFTYHMGQVIYNMALMFLIILVLWCVFQGLTWWIAQKINKSFGRVKVEKFLSYLGSFVVSSILFFIVTLLLIMYFVKKYIDIGFAIDAVMTQKTLILAYSSCLVIIWYFGFVSYAIGDVRPLTNIKKAFVIGVKKFTRMAPTILFLAVFYLIMLKFWTFLLGLTNNYVGFAFGLLIFIPSITFSKVVFIKTAEYMQRR